MATNTHPQEKHTGLIINTPKHISLRIAMMAYLDEITLNETQFRIFLEACAWLYGNLPLTVAYDLYKNKYKADVTKSLFTTYVKNLKKDDESFCRVSIIPLCELYCDVLDKNFWNQEIIYPELLDIREDGAPLYYKIAENKRRFNKPLRTLPWEQFIEFSLYGTTDTDSIACKKAVRFFQKLNFSTDKKIDNFIGRLLESSHLGRNQLTFLKRDVFYKSFIASQGSNIKTINRGLSLIGNITNHTATMINNGFSPIELREITDQENDEQDQKTPPRVTFTKRTEQQIKDGTIDVGIFAELVQCYPENIRTSAWEEFRRIRGDTIR